MTAMEFHALPWEERERIRQAEEARRAEMERQWEAFLARVVAAALKVNPAHQGHRLEVRWWEVDAEEEVLEPQVVCQDCRKTVAVLEGREYQIRPTSL